MFIFFKMSASLLLTQLISQFSTFCSTLRRCASGGQRVSPHTQRFFSQKNCMFNIHGCRSDRFQEKIPLDFVDQTTG